MRLRASFFLAVGTFEWKEEKLQCGRKENLNFFSTILYGDIPNEGNVDDFTTGKVKSVQKKKHF